MSKNAPADSLAEQPFVSHLIELRDRLLHALYGVGLVLICLLPFANDLYSFVAAPLIASLPQGSTMIATGIASPFLAPFKLTAVLSAILAMPWILYQVWAFVAPGLYQHEQRLIVPLVVSSTLLFYLGMLFAYYLVFGVIFGFLMTSAPDVVQVSPDINEYLSFVLTLFVAFGIAFETPVATVLLVKIGVATPDGLAEKRPYIIVGAFTVGMVLTPPDVFSQTLLAVPMWMLFEVGLYASRLIVAKEADADAAEEDGDLPPSPTSPTPPPLPTKPGPAAPASGALPGVIYGGEVHVLDHVDTDRYRPLTPAELDAELNQIEAEEAAEKAVVVDQRLAAAEPAPDPIENKLREVQRLRDDEDLSGARQLLYEVLADGDAGQKVVARNILAQLDAD